MSKEFFSRLAKIQSELVAPKGQTNTFGNYRYRSCEDILEAVKPLLDGLFLSISDEIVQIGDRFYVKAVATITDGEVSHSATAMAREEAQKKGMDSAQVTGATSSYARKYCLNGLFGIDDSKDADTDELKHQQNNAHAKQTINADAVLKGFSSYANSETDTSKLTDRYQAVWHELDGFPEHQEKCREVTTIRRKELKQQTQAA